MCTQEVYLEKSGVNQACVVVDELEQEHFHSITRLVFHLSSRSFQICTFSGNNLKYKATNLKKYNNSNYFSKPHSWNRNISKNKIIVGLLKYVEYFLTSIMIALIDAATPVAKTRAYFWKNSGNVLVAWNMVAMRISRNAITDTTPSITALSCKRNMY